MYFSTDVQISGANFGLPQHPAPVVYIGPNICQSVLRVNTTFLQCTATSSVIGRMVVNVSLGGLHSQEPLFIDRMCGGGYTGLLGQHCGPCPVVRVPTHSHVADIVLIRVVGCARRVLCVLRFTRNQWLLQGITLCPVTHLWVACLQPHVPAEIRA